MGYLTACQIAGRMAPFFTVRFNEIFKSGSYPDAWTKAVFVPMHT